MSSPSSPTPTRLLLIVQCLVRIPTRSPTTCTFYQQTSSVRRSKPLRRLLIPPGVMSLRSCAAARRKVSAQLMTGTPISGSSRIRDVIVLPTLRGSFAAFDRLLFAPGASLGGEAAKALPLPRRILCPPARPAKRGRDEISPAGPPLVWFGCSCRFGFSLVAF